MFSGHNDYMCVGATRQDMCLPYAANQSQKRVSQENEGSEAQSLQLEDSSNSENCQKAAPRVL